MSRSIERKRREARISELTVKYDRTKDPVLLVMRGMNFLGLKNDKEALRDFNSVIRIDKGIRDAWNGRTAALINLGQYQDARKTLEKILEMETAGAFRQQMAKAA